MSKIIRIKALTAKMKYLDVRDSGLTILSGESSVYFDGYAEFATIAEGIYAAVYLSIPKRIEKGGAARERLSAESFSYSNSIK